MKKTSMLFVHIAVLAGVCAYADTDPLMQAIDRNGDGTLQQAEIDMAVAALRSLDRNHDGTVDSTELAKPAGQAARPEGRNDGERRPEGASQNERQGRQRGGPDLSRLDADGDGKVSKDEAPERLKERFDTIDTNGDGYINKQEQEQMMQRMRDRGGQQMDRNRRSQEDTTGGETPKRPKPIE